MKKSTLKKAIAQAAVPTKPKRANQTGRERGKSKGMGEKILKKMEKIISGQLEIYEQIDGKKKLHDSLTKGANKDKAFKEFLKDLNANLKKYFDLQAVKMRIEADRENTAAGLLPNGQKPVTNVFIIKGLYDEKALGKDNTIDVTPGEKKVPAFQVKGLEG
jgi:hypothetical protein